MDPETLLAGLSTIQTKLWSALVAHRQELQHETTAKPLYNAAEQWVMVEDASLLLSKVLGELVPQRD